MEESEHHGGKKSNDGRKGQVEPEVRVCEDHICHTPILEEAAVECGRAGDGDDHEPGEDAQPHKHMHDGIPIRRVQCNLQQINGCAICKQVQTI